MHKTKPIPPFSIVTFIGFDLTEMPTDNKVGPSCMWSPLKYSSKLTVNENCVRALVTTEGWVIRSPVQL